MPLPTPNKGEERGTFVGRCMGNSVARQESPNNDQRLAVCHSIWKRKSMSSIVGGFSREALENNINWFEAHGFSPHKAVDLAFRFAIGSKIR